jgi:hypothetical protein
MRQNESHRNTSQDYCCRFNPKITDVWFERLLQENAKLIPTHNVSSSKPAKDTQDDRTVSHHVVFGATPHKMPLPFTWRDTAIRGLALVARNPDAMLEEDQQGRLQRVFVKLLQEGTKDAYMVWEDFRNIDGSRPLPNYNEWLQTIVRHWRQVLRIRNLFGPQITDEDLLTAFIRWDKDITRTLRNINLLVKAAWPVVESGVVLSPVWQTVFHFFDGLIAADQQILSCYCAYWKALARPRDGMRSTE